MNNNWLDLETLEDYLDGKLDAKTMNMVEREALEDPFVAEALAGLSTSPKRSLQSLSILQKQLQERISQQQTTKKSTVITWQRLSIAAAAAVLFIAASIMFWFRESNHQKQLASLEHKKVEVVLAPKEDSAGTAEQNNAIKSASSLATNIKKSVVKRKIPIQQPATETEEVIAEANANAYAANSRAGRPVLKGIRGVRPGYSMPREQEARSADAQINMGSKQVFSRVMEGKTAGISTSDSAQNVNTLSGKVTDRNDEPVLNEVVIGYGTTDNERSAYILKNNRFANEPKLHESVTLTFNVNEEGNPTNIKVTKSLGKKYDEEAVRLIKGGPKWKQPQDHMEKVVFSIEF